MIFKSFALSHESVISATAQGHPDEVMIAFREACKLIFANQGPWRITEVSGRCRPEMRLDSEMEWTLRAERKSETKNMWSLTKTITTHYSDVM